MPAPLPSPVARPGRAPGAPVIDVVVPVHDEEADLEPCLRRLHAHLTDALPYPFRITVAENASTDGTVAVARRVAGELPGIEVLVLPEAGRGRALRTAWLRSDAPGYNLLLRGTLATSLSDAQCGFKAIRADVAARLLPLVEDTGWFFDTELLVLAERSGLRIHEVPVDWIDDPDSRVDILRTARADLAGIARLLRAFTTGRLPVAELRAQIGRQPLPDPLLRGWVFRARPSYPPADGAPAVLEMETAR